MSSDPASSPSTSEGERAAAHAACEGLFLDFHGLIDRGVASQALELFDDEGLFEVRGDVLRGRDAIGGFLRKREAAVDRHTRHLATNFRFALLSPTQAEATANLILFTRAEGDGSTLALEAVVDCQLTFIRRDDALWRIASRRHVRFGTHPAAN
jgi:hypothetical protein